MKRIITAAFLLLCLLLLAGCSWDSKKPMQTESTDEPIKATYIPQEYTQPVIVRTNIYAYENGYAVYPVILGKGSIKQINNKIFQIVQNYLSMYGKYINDMDFDVMYNDKGILSLVIYGYGDDENYTRYIPMNFDCNTGKQLSIADLFPKDSDEWRSILASSVQNNADKLSFTLFSDIKPIEDDRMFYLTINSVVLVYNLYEITTYAQGMPRFVIPYHSLSGIIEQDSYIARIVKE